MAWVSGCDTSNWSCREASSAAVTWILPAFNAEICWALFSRQTCFSVFTRSFSVKAFFFLSEQATRLLNVLQQTGVFSSSDADCGGSDCGCDTHNLMLHRSALMRIPAKVLFEVPFFILHFWTSNCSLNALCKSSMQFLSVALKLTNLREVP